MNVDDGNMANAPAAFIDDGNINLCCCDTKEIAKKILLHCTYPVERMTKYARQRQRQRESYVSRCAI